MNYEGFKMLRGFGDRLTNGRTFVNVESLSRLKIDTNSTLSAVFLDVFPYTVLNKKTISIIANV